MTANDKKLYTAFSPYNFIGMILLRLAIAIGLVYTLPHFNENPVLITIVSIIAAAAIIFLGDDQVVVYTDRIEQSTNSFADYFFKLKAKTYAIKDIQHIYLEPPPPPSSALETGVAILLAAALNPKRGHDSSDKKLTKILIDLKDGQTATILTDLEDKKVAKIIETVNSLIPKHKAIK